LLLGQSVKRRRRDVDHAEVDVDLAVVVPRLLGKSPAAFLVATIPAAALLIAEIAIAHKLLAAQFDELDIANDLENATP
jgi:hypothetical protein